MASRPAGHRRAALAGVAVQAGGQVGGQHRLAAAIHVGQPSQQGGCTWARVGQIAAQAEQGIDGQVKVRGRLGLDGDARLHGTLACGPRVSRLLSAGQPGQAHLPAAMVQVPGCFEAVATVVAWSASDPNMPAMRDQGLCQAGHGQTRSLHEGVGR